MFPNFNYPYLERLRGSLNDLFPTNQRMQMHGDFQGFLPIRVHFVWVGVILMTPTGYLCNLLHLVLPVAPFNNNVDPRKKVRWTPAASCCTRKKIRVESCAVNAWIGNGISLKIWDGTFPKEIWMEVTFFLMDFLINH